MAVIGSEQFPVPANSTFSFLSKSKSHENNDLVVAKTGLAFQKMRALPTAGSKSVE
jgi:hypothetical protein